MSNNVFANGREISAKSSMGKSIASFPDVCFTPPLTPATPPGVPIPYPNTAMASDTTAGSKTTKIVGKEVILKNKSHYKTSYGDEAGSAPKKGVVTSKIKGKAYFTSWSMDVKFEGENVARHLDFTTHNHGSPICNAPPQLNAALMAAAKTSECMENMLAVARECNPWEEKSACPEDAVANVEKAEAARDALPTGSTARAQAQLAVRERYMEYTHEINKNPCRKAMKCVLMPYDDMEGVKCPKQTGEHLIEKSSFDAASHPDYRMGNAPTSFTEGPSYHIGEHGVLSLDRKEYMQEWRNENPGKDWTVEDGAELGAAGHCEQNQQCNKTCIKEQIIRGHEEMGVQRTDPIDQNPSGSTMSERDREILKLAREQRADALST
ncbi:MAG: DUF4150 domain-containing protein [Pseudomonadota bacterium]